MSEPSCHHCGGLHETADHALVQLAARAADAHAFVQGGEGRRGSWMQTFTGRKFWPLDPRADEIALEDIAHGLAMTCRYGGHPKHFYSVAEHAVLVSLYVPSEFALHGLLHDSAETYIGDMIRPLKHTPEMSEFRRTEERIEVAVAEAFGLAWTPQAHAAVKEIDDRILVDEITELMADPTMYLETGRLAETVPVGALIVGLPPYLAETAFLARYRELTA